MRLPAISQTRGAYAALLLVMATYLFIVRVIDSADTFLLLRDQIRDWRLALGPLGNLPLTGTPSTAGGASLGPVYYWVLWASRVVFGPVTQNLPHAGAWGIAVLQTAADLVLLDVLRRRTGSLLSALAAVLLMATVPQDLSITGTIWNPAVSVAFAKLALALRLAAPPGGSAWWTVATMACAWFAVQAHSSAIFVAAALGASFVVPDLRPGRLLAAAQQVRAIAEVILLLQVPYIVHLIAGTEETAPTRALGNAAQVLTADGHYRLVDSARALVAFGTRLVLSPAGSGWGWQVVVVALLAVFAIRARRDLAMLASTVLPLILAVLGFALWQGNYDGYWYLPLLPSLAIALVSAVTRARPAVMAPLLLAALLAVQPARITQARGMDRMPVYGALARDSAAILRQTPVVRRIDTAFRVPPLSDRDFLFEAMGGRLDPTAEFDAWIEADGSVRFRPVAR